MPLPAHFPSRLPTRLTVRAVAAAAATAVTVSLLTALTPGASADVASIPETDISGYAEIRDPYVYVSRLERDELLNAGRVIHVDTEHSDETGFWYARETLRPIHAHQPRDFQWFYQPWGATCEIEHSQPVFSAWMNTWACDNTLEDMLTLPGAAQAKAQCDAGVASQPWLRLVLSAEPGEFRTECSGASSLSPFMSTNHWLYPSTWAVGMECAPWEAIGCRSFEYSWSKKKRDVVADLWRPAPDTCTGLPADANRHNSPVKALEAPAQPVCSGEELASNCPAGSEHAACSPGAARAQGAENPGYGWVTDTDFVVAKRWETVTGTATRTMTTERGADRVSVYAYARWRGHQLRKKATTRAIVKESATVTRTLSQRWDMDGGARVTGVGRTSAQATAHQQKIGTPAALHQSTGWFSNLLNHAQESMNFRAGDTARWDALAAVDKAVLRRANSAELAVARTQARSTAASILKINVRSIESSYQKAKRAKAKYATAKKKITRAKSASAKRNAQKAATAAKKRHRTLKKAHTKLLKKAKA